jgi:hypothetical protein
LLSILNANSILLCKWGETRLYILTDPWSCVFYANMPLFSLLGRAETKRWHEVVEILLLIFSSIHNMNVFLYCKFTAATAQTFYAKFYIKSTSAVAFTV